MPQSYQNANIKPGMRRRPVPNSTPSPTAAAAALAAAHNKNNKLNNGVAAKQNNNVPPARPSPASADHAYQYQLKLQQAGAMQPVHINNIINRGGGNSPQPLHVFNNNNQQNFFGGSPNVAFNRQANGIGMGASPQAQGGGGGGYVVKRPQDGNVRSLPIQQFSFTPVPAHGIQAGVLMQPTPSPRAYGQSPQPNDHPRGAVEMNNNNKRPVGDISSAHVLDDRIRARMREGANVGNNNNLNRHNNAAVTRSAELQRVEPNSANNNPSPAQLFRGNFVLPTDGTALAVAPPLNRYQQKQQDIQHNLILRQMELLRQKQQLQEQEARQRQMNEYQQLQRIPFPQQPPQQQQQQHSPSHPPNNTPAAGFAFQQPSPTRNAHQPPSNVSPPRHDGPRRSIPLSLKPEGLNMPTGGAAINKKQQPATKNSEGEEQESIYNVIPKKGTPSPSEKEQHPPNGSSPNEEKASPSQPPPHVDLDEIIRNYTARNPVLSPSEQILGNSNSPNEKVSASNNADGQKSSPVKPLDAARIPQVPHNSKHALAQQLQAQNAQQQGTSPLKPYVTPSINNNKSPLLDQSGAPKKEISVGAGQQASNTSESATTAYGQQLQRLVAAIFPNSIKSPTNSARQNEGSNKALEASKSGVLPLPPLAYEIVYCSSEMLPSGDNDSNSKLSLKSDKAAGGSALGRHSAMELIKAVEGQWKVYTKEFPKALERALQTMPPPTGGSGKSPLGGAPNGDHTTGREDSSDATSGAAPATTISATSALSDGWYSAPVPIASTATGLSKHSGTPLPDEATEHSADIVSPPQPDIVSPSTTGYPVELILRFPSGDVDLSQLQLLVHETKIPARVEVRVFSLSNHWARLIAKKEEKKNKKDNKRSNTPPPEGTPLSELPTPSVVTIEQLSSLPISELMARYSLPSYKEVKFQKLGSVAFSNNEKTKFKAKERKTIHLEGQKAYFLKLIFSAPYVNHYNNDNTPHSVATGEDVVAGAEVGAGVAGAGGITTGTQIGLYSVLCMGNDAAPMQQGGGNPNSTGLQHADGAKYTFTAAVPTPYNWLKVMIGAETHRHKEEQAEAAKERDRQEEEERKRKEKEQEENRKKQAEQQQQQHPAGLVTSPTKPTAEENHLHPIDNNTINNQRDASDIVIANRDIRSGGGVGIGGLGGKKLRGAAVGGGPLSLRATQETPNTMAQSAKGERDHEGGTDQRHAAGRASVSGNPGGLPTLSDSNIDNEVHSFSGIPHQPGHYPKPVGPVAGIETLDPTEDERMFVKLHLQAKGGVVQPIHSPMGTMTGGAAPSPQQNVVFDKDEDPQTNSQPLALQAKPSKQQKNTVGRRSSLQSESNPHKPPQRTQGKTRLSPHIQDIEESQQQQHHQHQVALPPVITPFRSLPLQQFEPFLTAAVEELADLKQNAIARESYDEAQFYKNKLSAIEKEADRIYELESLKVNAIYSEEFTLADQYKRDMNKRMAAVKGFVSTEYKSQGHRGPSAMGGESEVRSLPPLKGPEVAEMNGRRSVDATPIASSTPPPKSTDSRSFLTQKSVGENGEEEEELSGETEQVVNSKPSAAHNSNIENNVKPNTSNIVLQDDQPVQSRYAQKMADDRRRQENDRYAQQQATDAIPPSTPHSEKKIKVKRNDESALADEAAPADADNDESKDQKGSLEETNPPPHTLSTEPASPTTPTGAAPVLMAHRSEKETHHEPGVAPTPPRTLPPASASRLAGRSPTPSLSAQQQANPNSFYAQWEQPIVDRIHEVATEIRRAAGGGGGNSSTAEDDTAVNDSAQTPEEGLDDQGDEEEKILTEPAATRTESQPLTSAFGSYTAACLLSKRWRLREAALVVLADHLGTSLYVGSASSSAGNANGSSSTVAHSNATNTKDAGTTSAHKDTPNIGNLENISNDDAFLYSNGCRASIYAFLMYANVKGFGLNDPVSSCAVATCDIIQRILGGRYRAKQAIGALKEGVSSIVREQNSDQSLVEGGDLPGHNGSNVHVLFCSGALLALLPRVVARAVAPPAAPLSSFGKSPEPSLMTPNTLLPDGGLHVVLGKSSTSSNIAAPTSSINIVALQTFLAFVVSLGADRALLHGILADPTDADKRKLPNPSNKIQLNRLHLFSLLLGIAAESVASTGDSPAGLVAKSILSTSTAAALLPPQSQLEQQCMSKLLVPALNHPHSGVREAAVLCTVKMLLLQSRVKATQQADIIAETPVGEGESTTDDDNTKPREGSNSKLTSIISILVALFFKKYGAKIGNGSKTAIEEQCKLV